MLLENNNVMIYGGYGGGGFINDTVARTLANLTTGKFPFYMALASMTTEHQRKATR